MYFRVFYKCNTAEEGQAGRGGQESMYCLPFLFLFSPSKKGGRDDFVRLPVLEGCLKIVTCFISEWKGEMEEKASRQAWSKYTGLYLLVENTLLCVMGRKCIDLRTILCSCS